VSFLGTTVFRDDIAQATGLAQAVVVTNTADQAVPVREQNRDGNQNIKVHEQGTASVHEQGTANVNVTGGTVNLGSTPIATRHEWGTGTGGPGSSGFSLFPLMRVSNLVISASQGAVDFFLKRGGSTGQVTYQFRLLPNTSVSIPFYDRVDADVVVSTCVQACSKSWAIVGR
jgi:hypothetical protein